MKTKIFWKSALFLLALWIPSAVWADRELKEVKFPVNYPVNFFWVYVAFGIFVVFLFLFLRKVYLTIRQAENKKTIKRDPAEVAYARLEELRAQNLPTKGELKQYYTSLCDILHRYCEDYLKIKAVEMTTFEFLEYIQKSKFFNKDQQILFEEFLDSCDMVKFAKHTPGVAEAEQSFQLAKKIIDLTKHQPNVRDSYDI